jgi:hypothetical protein
MAGGTRRTHQVPPFSPSNTDTDLPAAACGRTTDLLLAAARRLPFLGEQLSASDWSRAEHRTCAAHGVVLEPAAGDGWIAVGDAAFAVDPLSSIGLFNALYFGLAAAETADRILGGDPSAAVDYAKELQGVRNAYAANIASFYRLERRWAERPFWRRRHGDWRLRHSTHIGRACELKDTALSIARRALSRSERWPT